MCYDNLWDRLGEIKHFRCLREAFLPRHGQEISKYTNVHVDPSCQGDYITFCYACKAWLGIAKNNWTFGMIWFMMVVERGDIDHELLGFDS
jgi:hypothetical protein